LKSPVIEINDPGYSNLFLDALNFGSEHRQIRIYAAPEIANEGPVHVLVSYQTYDAIARSLNQKAIYSGEIE
jgi:hypothetical protein